MINTFFKTNKNTVNLWLRIICLLNIAYSIKTLCNVSILKVKLLNVKVVVVHVQNVKWIYSVFLAKYWLVIMSYFILQKNFVDGNMLIKFLLK